MKAAEAFYALVRERRSIRRFERRPVPREKLLRILQAATRAPSAHNRQPWRFVVVQQVEVRRRLVEAMEASWREDLAREGLPAAEIEARMGRNRKRLLGAPALLIMGLSMEDMDRYPDERRQRAEHIMAVQSVAMAGALSLLAAQAEGLGACWVCAPLFAPDAVRRVLNLPQDWQPQGAVLLGYPEGAGAGTARRPLDQVVMWR